MDEETKRIIEASGQLSSLHLVAQIVLAQVFLHDKQGFLRIYEMALRKTKYDAAVSPNVAVALAFDIQTATLESTKMIFRQAAVILGIEKELAEVESNLARHS